MGANESACISPAQGDSAELNINDLPNEMLQHIFDFLPHLQDRKKLSLICQRWNDLAFQKRYLRHVRLNLMLGVGSVKKLHTITRYYRAVHLSCNIGFKLNKYKIKRLLKRLEKPCSSLEKLVVDDSSLHSLALRLLPKCPCVKKLHLESAKSRSYDKLPVLENLEELTVTNMSGIDIVHLAPNLRRLETVDEFYDTPMIIRKLPLQHLRVSFSKVYTDLLRKCTKITQLTSVDLFHNPIDQNGFENLCALCPSLTKLQITVSSITSLHCSASLKNLKFLGLDYCNHHLFESDDFRLRTIEIVVFTQPQSLHFVNAMQRIFPNVHRVKFDCGGFDSMTGNIGDGFPQLRTLELMNSRDEDLRDLLEELSDLRELIMRASTLSGSHLPPMNLEQLTLKNSLLEVTNEMADNLPKLKFLNLFGYSRYIKAEKIPSGCMVRQYLRDSNEDVK